MAFACMPSCMAKLKTLRLCLCMVIRQSSGLETCRQFLAKIFCNNVRCAWRWSIGCARIGGCLQNAAIAQDLAAVVDTLIPGRRFSFGRTRLGIDSKLGACHYRAIEIPCCFLPAFLALAWITWGSGCVINGRALGEFKRDLLKQLTSSWYIVYFQLPVLA